MLSKPFIEEKSEGLELEETSMKLVYGHPFLPR